MGKGEREDLQDFFHSDVPLPHHQEEPVHHEAGVCRQGGEGKSALRSQDCGDGRDRIAAQQNKNSARRFCFLAMPAAEYSALRLRLRLSCRWWACTCRAWAPTKCCRALPSQSKWALPKQTLTGPLPFIRLHLRSLSQCANANAAATPTRLFITMRLFPSFFDIRY